MFSATLRVWIGLVIPGRIGSSALASLANQRCRTSNPQKRILGGNIARFVVLVNDRSAEVDVAEDMPLLYVLANALDLKGPRFGCGLAAVTVYFGRGEFGQGTLTGMML